MAAFGIPKPAASLSSGLLARKGQARPAMRPHGFAGFGGPSGALDDLGWNDMGQDAGADAAAPAAAPSAEPAALPPVLREREALKDGIEAPVADVAPLPIPMPTPAPIAPGTVSRIAKQAAGQRGKAAFTLRLDHDRHLRLRLASAVANRSAQALVTDALDAFLHTLPQVEALAQTLPPTSARAKKD